MKMTYFVRPDHSYHRIMFEFTDTETKAVGFEKISLVPSRLEILKILNRLTETDGKQQEKPVSLDENNPLSRVKAGLKELHEYANAGNYEIVKNLLKQIHNDNKKILKRLKKRDK